MFSKEEINNVFWLLKHPVGIVKIKMIPNNVKFAFGNWIS